MAFVLKVSCDGELRRLQLETEPAHFADVQAAIEKVWPELRDATIHYRDDEGDACQLCAASFSDFMSHGVVTGGKTVLRVELSPTAAAPTVPVSTEKVGDAMAAAAAADAMEVETEATPASAQAAATSQEEKSACAAEDPLGGAAHGNPCGSPADEAFAHFAVHLLPLVSAAAQNEPARARLSAAGAEHREQFLPYFTRMLATLDSVPEAAPLGPRLRAYVDGTDKDHLGDVLADLLRAWASSHAHEAVRQTLKENRDVLQAVAARVFGGPGFPDVFGGMPHGMPFAGFPFAPQPRNDEGAGAAASSPCGGPAANGFGGVGGAGGVPGGLPPALVGLLGALGQHVSQEMAQGFAAAGSSSSSSACTQPQSTTTRTQTTATAARNFDKEVQHLLDMGLVGDAELARDLLEVHDGDVSKVVAVLTA